MKSFRSKPVGWRGESHRHYLAAKGISTKSKRLFAMKDAYGDDRIKSVPVELKEKYGLYVDNPGGKWLKGEQERYPTSSITGGTFALPVPVEDLRELPGARGEEEFRGKEDWSRRNIEELKKSIAEEGFRQDNGPLIWVYADGRAVVAEGNHRIVAADELGMETLPAQFRWFNGAENVEGKWGVQHFIDQYNEGTDEYNAVKWKLDDPNQIIEWQDPREFVQRTHQRDIEDVPQDAPHYFDSQAKEFRPTRMLAERFIEGAEVKPLEDWYPDDAVISEKDGKKMIDGNKLHVDGRHRAWAAWATGEKKVPVVVGVKK